MQPKAETIKAVARWTKCWQRVNAPMLESVGMKKKDREPIMAKWAGEMLLMSMAARYGELRAAGCNDSLCKLAVRPYDTDIEATVAMLDRAEAQLAKGA